MKNSVIYNFWHKAIKYPFLVSFIMGSLSVLALPPIGAWPVLFITMSVFALLMDELAPVKEHGSISAKLKYIFYNRKLFFKAGFLGWCFGFGYFVTSLHWMGFAFLVEANKFAILLPLVIIGMPAFLACFYFFISFSAACFWSSGINRFLVLAAMFAIFEWLRGHILTGLPWNSIGYGLLVDNGFLQFVSVVGLYGVNFFAVLFFVLPVMFWGNQNGILSIEKLVAFFVLSLMIVVALAGYYRISQHSNQFVDNVQLRLVQPNIPQKKKTQREAYDWIFAELIKNSISGNRGSDITHIIWPEVAVPVLLARDYDKRRQIAKLLNPGSFLLTGAYRLEETQKVDKYKVYNSLITFNSNADVVHYYDKIHLVPFGEYLPFQKTLEKMGFEQITRIKGGFEAGKGKRYMVLPQLPPLSPLICYEVIFPGKVVDEKLRPSWLLNITNDAWFGNSLGPYQHFQQARTRAVEEGLPLIRVANTGISAVIDPLGQVLISMGIGRAGHIDYKLPKALGETFYVKWREYIFPIIIFAAFFLYLILGFLEDSRK